MSAAHRRERSVALAIATLAAVLALARPAYFSPENLVDLLLSNLGVMTTAIGTTLVILTGEIDISVGSVFAICSVAAGAAAVRGAPLPAVALVACATGAVLGLLTGVGALLNAVRFHQIPSNGGIGLEMKVIAAVVVGGAAVTGGRGTLAGTALGVVLLGAIGPALTFLGVSAYWERALQGAIILAAVAGDAIGARHAAGARAGAAAARV